MPKKTIIPEYDQVERNGLMYYRTRIWDENGKRKTLYGKTEKDLQQKALISRQEIEEKRFRNQNPTVAEYCRKWLEMQTSHLRRTTLKNYEYTVNKYIVKPLGDMYMSEVTADDIKLALIPVAGMAESTYAKISMFYKSIFYSAQDNHLIADNPAAKICVKGGTLAKEKDALTDEQVDQLLEAIKGLPPYVFVMLGLYAGLRTEEILGLKWDCVFLRRKNSYISVKRAWHREHNRPVITTQLKSESARRDIPIPECLANCLRAAKREKRSEYVISDSDGNPLSDSQFRRMWHYINVRSTKERTLYKYINGQSIRKTIKPLKGERCRTDKELYYCLDFTVTPHQLRHTYITNLINAGIDPKTVQYLAGHKNSQITMDIYAKVKYNRPGELLKAVDDALTSKGDDQGKNK